MSGRAEDSRRRERFSHRNRRAASACRFSVMNTQKSPPQCGPYVSAYAREVNRLSWFDLVVRPVSEIGLMIFVPTVGRSVRTCGQTPALCRSVSRARNRQSIGRQTKCGGALSTPSKLDGLCGSLHVRQITRAQYASFPVNVRHKNPRSLRHPVS